MEATELSHTALVRRTAALEAQLLVAEAELNTDALTGLGNRRFLERREHARGGVYVMCDLNNFKAAQDNHPDKHDHGDWILQQFARHLNALCRGLDRIAVRYGGDEFVVWTEDTERAAVLALAIRQWECSGVTVSAGIGTTLKEADRAMYTFKKSRRAA